MSVVSRVGNEGPMNRDSIPGGAVHPSVDPPTVLCGRWFLGDKAAGARR